MINKTEELPFKQQVTNIFYILLGLLAYFVSMLRFVLKVIFNKWIFLLVNLAYLGWDFYEDLKIGRVKEIDLQTPFKATEYLTFAYLLLGMGYWGYRLIKNKPILKRIGAYIFLFFIFLGLSSLAEEDSKDIWTNFLSNVNFHIALGFLSSLLICLAIEIGKIIISIIRSISFSSGRLVFRVPIKEEEVEINLVFQENKSSEKR